MIRGINNKQITRVVLTLSAVMFVASVIVHQQRDFLVYRGLRGVICVAFLIMMTVFSKRRPNAIIFGFLILYSISSFLTIWYENNILAISSMVANFLAYIVLIVGLIPKVSFRKMNLTLVILFALLVGLNGYLLYELVLMIKNFTQSNLHYLFILLGAMSLVIVAFFALLYNYIYSSKASLIFTLSIFTMIFNEVFRAIGYYDFAYGDISVYAARALLIIGLALLLNYALLDKKSTEVLGK